MERGGLMGAEKERGLGPGGGVMCGKAADQPMGVNDGVRDGKGGATSTPPRSRGGWKGGSCCWEREWKRMR